ncbi:MULTISPECIES: hypothetical protein [unclassified Mycolicibacterium]|uniref:hypothetical protein n=2 Tax=Mycolicibacterium TaxID=1866885 RepID=UPI0012DEE5AB|nr:MULTISPECIES: hypothetical protein [unclassified Mycolicibacterium]MUL84310.1 hypothetical protein [Mycolicibacterium sp. CBMA 329]MUL89624.1 hypothetical protein [Mycolicibacterium sp. CBMA 331]MUL99800.1 hypothetical protein [Mycolicibacterium sp. CBMA 334]MUM39139.1 hypothetical protein [Mycolicibacterium sp. CBMA 247]MUM46225.1 hypothetical protein [Mycolicibacterium sp. CBMA 294]
MQITEPDRARYWHQIASHTLASTNGSHTSAPWPVQVQAAALVGNSTVEASVSRFDGSGPSTWVVALITADARLIQIRMQFDAEQYDLEKDQGDPLAATVNESWVRRLSDVESLRIGGARMRPNTFGRTMPDVLDVGGVTLTFRGGTVGDLGFDQLAMTMYDDRRQSDGFVELLRQQIGL